MSLDVNRNEKTVVITLGDKFDFDSVEDFRACYVDDLNKSYVVDFRNTEYMDSSGLGMLLNMRRYLGENSAVIKLTNCRPQIKKILLISRFEKKFEIS